MKTLTFKTSLTRNGIRLSLPEGERWTEEEIQDLFMEEELLKILKEANGRRRTRTITTNDVINCITHLLGENNHDGYNFLIGGSVSNNYRYTARTTVMFCYLSDGDLFIGITEASAMNASLGRSWKEFNGLGNLEYCSEENKNKAISKWIS